MSKNKIETEAKMPRDFWNHGFNPITGFKCSQYTRESVGGIKTVRLGSATVVFKNFQV